MKLNLGGTLKEKPHDWEIVGKDSNSNKNHDLDDYPLPYEDNSIEEIYCSHTLEHLKEPLKFLEECYRIMEEGARMVIRVPHVAAKGGSFGTMEHRWHWHEYAINTIVGKIGTSIFPYKFKHIKTKVNRGKFLFWQKREIVWVIKKEESK